MKINLFRLISFSLVFLFLAGCGSSSSKKPPTPTNFTAIAYNTQVALNWKPYIPDGYTCIVFDGAMEALDITYGSIIYNVYDSVTSGGPYTKIGFTIIGENCTVDYAVTDLTNGTPYYFVVTTVNSNGESGYSNQASATPHVSYAYPVGLGPDGIAIDISGNVWVANQNSNTVTKLNSSGITIGTYGVGMTPTSIAIDASGNVWVTNNGDGTVTKLNSNGVTIGTYDVGIGPKGIAIDASGNVWVTNYRSTVTKISSSGAPMGTYSAVSYPQGIAIDGSGNVWVADFGNGLLDGIVTELNSSGVTIGTYSAGTSPGKTAIDASGNVWVTNEYNNTVTELNSSGITIGTYSIRYDPVGIAIDSLGNVWVVNSDGIVTELSSSGTTIGTYGVGLYPEACVLPQPCVWSAPTGIAIDSSGNVWIANNGNSNVTKLVGVTKGPQYWPYTGPQFPGGGNY